MVSGVFPERTRLATFSLDPERSFYAAFGILILFACLGGTWGHAAPSGTALADEGDRTEATREKRTAPALRADAAADPPAELDGAPQNLSLDSPTSPVVRASTDSSGGTITLDLKYSYEDDEPDSSRVIIKDGSFNRAIYVFDDDGMEREVDRDVTLNLADPTSTNGVERVETVGDSLANEGSYDIEIRATDENGNFTGIDDNQDFVKIDNTPPPVTGATKSADQFYGIGDTLTFDINYDEAVIVDESGGTPSIALDFNGSTKQATYASGSGTKTLTFNYVVEEGVEDGDGIAFASTTIQLNSGTLKDEAGNNADRDFSGAALDISGMKVDGIHAKMLSVDSPTDSTFKQTTQNFDVEYSYDETRPDAVQIRLVDPVGTVDARFDFDDSGYGGTNGTQSVTLDLDAADSSSVTAGTTYDLRVTAVDVAGNDTTTTGTDLLTTDDTPPTVTQITRSSPTEKEVNNSTVVFSVAFSELVENIDVSDFALGSMPSGGAMIDNVSSDSARSVEVTVNSISGDGELNLDVDGGTDIQDRAENGLDGTEPSTEEVYTIDNTVPSISSASTGDADGNGKIDRITLQYTEPVNITDGDAGNPLPGYSVDGGYTIADRNYSATSTSSLTLRLEESGSPDTDATPTVSYDSTVTGTKTVADAADNEQFNEDSTATDEAPPVLTIVETGANFLELSVAFSEPVWSNLDQTGDLEEADFDYTDASNGGVSVSSVTHTGGEETMTLSLGGEAEVRADELAAADLSSIYDGSDNAAPTTPVTVADGTGPDLVSATTGDANNDGTVDEITLTYTEPVDDDSVQAGDFSLSSPSGTVDTAKTGTSPDDDVTVLGVSDLGSNNTAVTPNVTLSSDAVADSAGNTGPSSPASEEAADRALPAITSATTVDRDTDGRVDSASIVFSEPIDDGTVSSDNSGDYNYAIGDSTVTGFDTGATSNDEQIQLQLSDAREVPGTDAKDVTYTPGTTADTTGNKLADVGPGDVDETDEADPAIIDGTLADDNSYVDVTISEDAYTNSSGDSLEAEDFSGVVEPNDGSVDGFSIDELTTTDGKSLTGGEDTVRAQISLNNAPASGDELIAIEPTDGSSVYDIVGNTLGAGESTDTLQLNDRKPPSIVSAKTLDRDADGQVDAADVTFSEPIDDQTVSPGDYALGDSTVTGFDTGASNDDDQIQLRLDESSEVAGTDTVEVTYTKANTADNTADLAGNELNDVSDGDLTEMDGASPVPLTAEAISGKDSVTVAFSEGVYTDGDGTGALQSTDFDYIDDSGDGASSVDGLESHSAGSDTATVSLDAGVQASDLSTDSITSKSAEIYDAAGNASTNSATLKDTKRPADPVATGGATIASDNETDYNVDVALVDDHEGGTVSVKLVDDNTDSVVADSLISAEVDGDAEKDTVTISGIDASSLVDGEVTITARIEDYGSNENSLGFAAPTDVAKNTDAPSGANIGLTASAVSGGDIDLNWDDIDDDTNEYSLRRSKTSGSNYSEVTTVDDDDSASYSYTDDGSGQLSAPSDGETYYYVVVPIDGVGNEGDPSNEASATADATSPSISDGSVAPNNSYVEVIFSEGVYTDGSGTSPLSKGDLALTFNSNGGSASDASIESLTDTTGSNLTGGEDTVRVQISLTDGPASGEETVEIEPKDGSSIYDGAGNAMGSGETTGTLSLNDRERPTVVSATTFDRNKNGKVDSANVVFSERVDPGSLGPDGYEIGGTTVEDISSGPTDDDTIHVRITTDANEVAGTNAKEVTYVKSNASTKTTDQAGNKLADVTEGDVSEIDKAAPVLRSATTADADGNGQIDEIELTYWEAIEVTDGDGSDKLPGYSVDGYDIEAADYGTADTTSSLTLQLVESGSADTDATPTVAYDQDATGTKTIADTTGNEQVDGDSQTATDGAPPVGMPAPVATAVSDGNIELTWDDLDKTAIYSLQRSTSQGGPYSEDTTITDDNSASYSYLDDESGKLSAPSDGETYYYVVVPIDGVGNEGDQSSEAFATADATPPANLTLERPTDSTFRQSSQSLDVDYSYDETRPDTTTIQFADGNGNTASFGVDDSGYAGDGSSKTATIDLENPKTGDLTTEGTYDLMITSTDSAGNSTTTTGSNRLTIDNTAPQLQTAVIEADSLFLVYDEILDAGSVPDPSDFDVTVNGSSESLASTDITTDTALVELSAEVLAGDDVSVTYAPGSTPIQDRAKNQEGSFVQSVTNNTEDTTPPTISAISDTTIKEDKSTGERAFTVDDNLTDPSDLIVSAGSDNRDLVPNDSLALGGSGMDRTITATPMADSNGTTTVTVTVEDEKGLINDTSFALKVDSVNDPPTLTGLPDTTTTDEDQTTDVNFEVDDVETDPSELDVTASSDNQDLVPDDSLDLGGSGIGRTITATPKADSFGTATITVAVTDTVKAGDEPERTTDTTFVLEVQSVNDPPVISAIADTTIDEDNSTGKRAFTVEDVETAATDLTLSATSDDQSLVPDDSLTLGGSGTDRTITATPAPDANGSATIEVIADDGTDQTTEAFLLTVEPVNDAPVIENNEPLPTRQGALRTIEDQDLLTTDLESGPAELVYTVDASNEPTEGRLVVDGNSGASSFTQQQINDGDVQYEDTTETTSDDDFDFVVTDQGGSGTDAQSQSGTFEIEVTTNSPPTARPDTFATDEDQTLAITDPDNGVLANDTDADRDPLSAELLEDVTDGTLTLELDGTFEYDPDPNFNGTDRFTYRARDGVTSDTAEVLLKVRAVNDTPRVATNAGLGLDEGGAASIEQGNLEVTDVESGPSALTYDLVSIPSNGVLTLGGDTLGTDSTFTQTNVNDGSLSYAHDGSETTRDSLVFIATDEAGVSTDTTRFSISITPVNDPPAITTNEGRTVVEGADSVLTADHLAATDVESGPADLTYTVESAPINGTLRRGTTTLTSGDTFTQADVNDGSLSYAHDGSETTSDSLDVVVTDGGGASTDVATFSISITPVNDAPAVTSNDGLTLEEGRVDTVQTAILETTDPDDAPSNLTYNITSPSSSGALTLSGDTLGTDSTFTQAEIDDEKLAYAHDGSETGSDGFVFFVTDDEGAATDTTTFAISITLVNETPVASNDQYATDEDQTIVVSDSADGVLGNDSDLDGDPLAASVVTTPSNGELLALNGNGTFEYKPAPNFNGTDRFEYEAGDPAGSADTATVEFTVRAVNDTPTVATNAPLQLDEGAAAPIEPENLEVTDVESGPSALTYDLVSIPSNGVLTLNGDTLGTDSTFTQASINNGQFAYAHDGSETTSDAFDFVATDEVGAPIDTATFSISVTPVNDPPRITTNAGLTLDENTTKTITTSELSVTDVDDEASALTYTVTTLPTEGRLVVEENAGATSFTQQQIEDEDVQYEHTAEEEGKDSFTFEFEDDAGAGGTGRTFEITARKVNNPPTTADEEYVVDPGDTLTVQDSTNGVLANDSDPDGDPLEASLESGPENGTVTLNADGTFEYTPDEGFNGMDDPFTYTALDGDEGATQGTAEIQVRPTQTTMTASRTFPNPSQQRSFRLVALPGASDTPLSSTLSGKRGKDWRAFRENGQSGGQPANRERCSESASCRLEAGTGYWLVSNNSWTFEESLETVSLEPGSIATRPVYRVPLQDGWNIVSNPVEQDISWSAVQNASGTNQQLYRWDGSGSWNTTETFASATEGEAYYFRDDEIDELVLPFPGLSPRSRSASEKKQVSDSTLTLHVLKDRDTVSTVRAGIRTEADAGLDRTDLHAPPGYFETVSLRLFEREDDRQYTLAAENVPPVQDGRVFDLRLQAPSDQVLTVAPEDADAFPVEQVALVHEPTGRSYNLRADSSFTIVPHSSTTSYRLLVGTERFVQEKRKEIAPPELKLLPNYPNPFRQATTIEYSLPDRQEVRLEVYDVLGRRVSVLVDETQRAGFHQIRWRVGNGSSVASGVYFVRLRTDTATKTERVVVVQ